MTNITIRDVPDELHTKLRARAASNGQSLRSYLLGELERLASKPTKDELLAVVRERVEGSGVYLTAEQIIEARDEGRR